MKKLSLLAAAAAGYVLGAQAGRERYEQIRAGARKVARNPKVQSATASAKSVAAEQASVAAGVAKEKVSDATHLASNKMGTATP